LQYPVIIHSFLNFFSPLTQARYGQASLARRVSSHARVAMQQMPEAPKYAAASREVGVRLISAAMESAPRTGDPRQDFLADHQAFMLETKQEYRVRTIGGGRLDLYRLYKHVLERGGVQCVTTNRAFKMVARSLNLPKSCTSAATVLRTSYIDQLYLYEQRHVNNRVASGDELYNPTNRHISADNSIATPRTVHGLALPPTPATAALSTGGRPRRQAAMASSTSGAFAASDDPYEVQRFTRRRASSGVDVASLTAHQLALVEQQLATDAATKQNTRNASLPFNPTIVADRERLVAALKCPIQSEIAWALGTLNVLSFDSRNSFHVSSYPGLLSALQGILHLHLEDVFRRRVLGGAMELEFVDPRAPRNAAMSAAYVREGGDPMTGGIAGAGLSSSMDTVLRAPSLQQEGSLFNVLDTMAVDREQAAIVGVNVLRNMSFTDRNAINLVTEKSLLDLTAQVLMSFQIVPTIRMALMDVWVNISPYLNVSPDQPGAVVLKTCIALLDPFLDGAETDRFSNAGEILARLAASPERNENAMVEQFPELLPRIIDIIGVRDRRYVNAGLAALCNCSAFDWPARGRIARVPRTIPRLIAMLSDPELAPRAALTLLNLAEAPSNRVVLLAYETQLVSHAMAMSPAAETVSSVLFDLSSWD
jgi:ARID/BRIGHT DNA binding domain